MINSNVDTKKNYLLTKIEKLQQLYNIKIKKIELTELIRGLVIYSKKTDSYLVLINKDLSENQMIKTLIHELSHIELEQCNNFLEDRNYCENIIKELLKELI